jgi:hypothetical protein
MLGLPLFDHVPRHVLGPRDGETFNSALDRKRLDGQALDVWQFMIDGKAHTPHEIEYATGYNWASISARLRDFRKPEFGGHEVVRTRLSKGLFSYRLIVRTE